MIKSKIGIITVLLIAAILLINIASSQDTNDEGVPEEVAGITDASEKIVGAGEDLSKIDFSSSDYVDVKEPWTSHPFFTNTRIGRGILKVNGAFEIFSPIFKILIGMNYSLSWLFFLSLGAWIAILIIIYKPISGLFQANPWISLLIALIIVTLGAQFGTIQLIVGFFVPIFKNKWIILLAIVIGAVIVYFYSSLIDSFAKSIKEANKKEDEERREQKAQTAERINDTRITAAGGGP